MSGRLILETATAFFGIVTHTKMKEKNDALGEAGTLTQFLYFLSMVQKKKKDVMVTEIIKLFYCTDDFPHFVFILQ